MWNFISRSRISPLLEQQKDLAEEKHPSRRPSAPPIRFSLFHFPSVWVVRSRTSVTWTVCDRPHLGENPNRPANPPVNPVPARPFQSALFPDRSSRYPCRRIVPCRSVRSSACRSVRSSACLISRSQARESRAVPHSVWLFALWKIRPRNSGTGDIYTDLNYCQTMLLLLVLHMSLTDMFV